MADYAEHCRKEGQCCKSCNAGNNNSSNAKGDHYLDIDEEQASKPDGHSDCAKEDRLASCCNRARHCNRHSASLIQFLAEAAKKEKTIINTEPESNDTREALNKDVRLNM